ncbi:hypothetical protein J1614_008431 [Plenodomus biglobosus]|nr:hypothetical protein J1614_008431 [Plenodomus biglobosus]
MEEEIGVLQWIARRKRLDELKLLEEESKDKSGRHGMCGSASSSKFMGVGLGGDEWPFRKACRGLWR